MSNPEPETQQARGIRLAKEADRDNNRRQFSAALEQIGRIAAMHGIVLSELAPQTASLEEAFMELTHDEVEYRTTSTNAGVNDAAGVAA